MKPYHKSSIPCYVICNRCGLTIPEDDQVMIDHSQQYHSGKPHPEEHERRLEEWRKVYGWPICP